jgi:hypothetical protein
MMGSTRNDSLRPAAGNSALRSTKFLNSTTLFWHPTGPRLEYQDGILHVEDLNPQIKTQWRMSRAEMIGLGWRCIIAALKTS